jgi:tetratricopeptide (TPR) repeat protein
MATKPSKPGVGCETRRAPAPAATQQQNAAVRRLAALFAEEPELVRACLQGIEREPADRARLILAAAQFATKAYPQYADLFYQAGQAAVAVGEYDTAATALVRAVELNPTYNDALILAGRVAIQRRRPEEAETLLLTALQAGADYPDVHMLLGNLWREQEATPRARAAYQRALELNPNLKAAQTALATLDNAASSGKSDELSA